MKKTIFLITALLTILGSLNAQPGVTTSGTDVRCFGGNDGSATATAFGGTPPYTYKWSTTPIQTNNTASGLSAGTYTVTVTDAASASDTSSVTITQPTPIIVNGTTTDITCVDSGTVSLSVSGGFSPYTYNWSIAGSSTGSIDVGPSNTGTISVTVTDNNNCTVPQNYAVQNLCIDVDAGVVAVGNAARPGFSHTINVIVRNNSLYNISLSGTVSLVLDSRLSYNFSSPSPISTAGGVLQWNYSNIPKGGFQNFVVYTTVATPPVAELGDILSYTAYITPTDTDAIAANNYFTALTLVTGSYDPNDISVLPRGYIYQNRDSMLFYTVRFQNTGTDTAFTVVIRDTLSLFLDPASVDMAGASHNFTSNLVQDSILEITFNNILLPDSGINEPGSNGFVSFFVKLKNNVPLESEISNSAAIYFDFNQPIITNTVVNTFTQPIYSNINTSICEGTAYQLGSQAITAQGTYQDTLSSVAGKDSIVTLVLALNNLPIPTVSRSNNVLSTQAFSAYQWLLTGAPINGANAQNYTATQNGNYAVIVVDGNSCSDTSAVFNVTGVGINEVSDLRFSIYPNPTTDVLYITCTEAVAHVGVYNMFGELVQEKTGEGNTLSVDVLAQGVYTISLKTLTGKMSVSRFVKQ